MSVLGHSKFPPVPILLKPSDPSEKEDETAKTIFVKPESEKTKLTKRTFSPRGFRSTISPEITQTIGANLNSGSIESLSDQGQMSHSTQSSPSASSFGSITSALSRSPRVISFEKHESFRSCSDIENKVFWFQFSDDEKMVYGFQYQMYVTISEVEIEKFCDAARKFQKSDKTKLILNNCEIISDKVVSCDGATKITNEATGRLIVTVSSNAISISKGYQDNKLVFCYETNDPNLEPSTESIGNMTLPNVDKKYFLELIVFCLKSQPCYIVDDNGMISRDNLNLCISVLVKLGFIIITKPDTSKDLLHFSRILNFISPPQTVISGTFINFTFIPEKKYSIYHNNHTKILSPLSLVYEFDEVTHFVYIPYKRATECSILSAGTSNCGIPTIEIEFTKITNHAMNSPTRNSRIQKKEEDLVQHKNTQYSRNISSTSRYYKQRYCQFFLSKVSIFIYFRNR